MNAEEKSKTLDEAQKIISWIVESFSAKKNLNFVSIGGGITQDVSGFVASILFRGVPWTFIPTTLLAQCDSCIGGKTSINFRHFKNLLGTFYPPREVHVFPLFTETLSPRDLQSGCGEIAKFLLMRAYENNGGIDDVASKLDGVLNDLRVREAAILESLKVKQSFICGDEFDRGRRNLLNYGHCFGHALETSSGYHVPHGIAVAIGMIFANRGAVVRGLVKADFADSVNRLICGIIHQRQRKSDYAYEILLGCIKNDKKRTGNGLPLVCPRENGLVLLKDLTEVQFRMAYELLLADIKDLF